MRRLLVSSLVKAAAIIFALFPVATFAAADIGLGVAGGVGLPGGLETLIANIIKAILGLVGVVALAVLVYGGFLYITASGDEKQISKAKTAITYAIIGIVVIGLSYALVSFVISIFQPAPGGGRGGI